MTSVDQRPDGFLEQVFGVQIFTGGAGRQRRAPALQDWTTVKKELQGTRCKLGTGQKLTSNNTVIHIYIHIYI